MPARKLAKLDSQTVYGSYGLKELKAQLARDLGIQVLPENPTFNHSTPA